MSVHTNVGAVAGSSSDSHRRAVGLRSGAVGLIGLATLGSVMMSPAMGLYATWGPLAGIVGKATPLVFLVALVVSAPTAISYAVICREMPSAGSAFTWVWNTISPSGGTWVGLMMAIYYTTAVIIQPILFGLFFEDFLSFIGVHSHGLGTWAVGAVLSLVIVAAIVLRGIELSTRAAVTMILIESAVVVALVVTIIGSKLIHGGFSFGPLNPSGIMGGSSGLYDGLLLGIFAYTGYDVISTVAEEAQAPRKLLPKATIISLVTVGLFWAVTSFGLSLSAPVSKIEQYNASGTTAVTPIANQFWGSGRILVILTALTAIVAVSVATTVGASRALYAMSREGVLPKSLGRIHSTFQVPTAATALVLLAALTGSFIVVFTLNNAIDGLTWWADALVFFALVTYAAVNLANLVLFTTRARARMNWFMNVVVPVAGIAIDGYLIYKSFFVSLWDIGWRTGRSVILVSMILVLLALVLVVFVRVARRSRLQQPAFEVEPALEIDRA
jgi:amino acid transporter